MRFVDLVYENGGRTMKNIDAIRSEFPKYLTFPQYLTLYKDPLVRNVMMLIFKDEDIFISGDGDSAKIVLSSIFDPVAKTQPRQVIGFPNKVYHTTKIASKQE
jgi:hypothetical protein